jgi:hypothetical protein
MSTTNGSRNGKYCLVCKTTPVEQHIWICGNCFRYVGKKVIEETIEECGGGYEKIPDHIPKEQQDDYFVKTLESKKEEMAKKKAISISSRKAKARELQKLVAQKISDLTGIPCGKDELIESREMGQAGTDIKLIGEAKRKFPFAIECKRQEKLNLHEAIKQAKANQDKDTDWLVVSRRSNEEAIVSMCIDTFFKLCKKALPSKGFFHKEPDYVIYKEKPKKENKGNT